MKRILILLQLVLYAIISIYGHETEYLYLSGRDAESPVNWEFKVSSGRKAGEWNKLPVPSNWELHGFGEYNYGHDKNKSNEIGFYKYSFNVEPKWKKKLIYIVFEGVMTDTEVRINGELVGPIHQGGFYRFQYNISRYLKFDDKNLLEVKVNKVSANESVELAERKSDYWIFGGIFRPVYLKVEPKEHIIRSAIDAKANGKFNINVFVNNPNKANKIKAQVITKNGNVLGNEIVKEVTCNDTIVSLQASFINQLNWTAESPNLYYVDVSILNDNSTIHTIREKFGFRTIEVIDGKGIFLNNNIITLKGCNRHSFWPTTGRALSRNQCKNDIELLKEMNMNAVRMSHYPPDSYFLDLCDEYGIYVLDEVAGWQKPSYDTPTSKRLIKQLVTRDVNHPSILFWDNGNEGGWNNETDTCFSRYDPQNRIVLHPWENFNGIDTDHYEDYESVKNKMKSKSIFMPTEHLHGLYDGGLGAGLDDFWKLMWGNPLNGGMFLWVFADEGIVRTDSNYIIDTDGNHAPDGILGPFHEKEASFYTIKEIWSPIYIETDSKIEIDDQISIEIENRYDFTNLKECSFKWELVKYREPFTDKMKNEIISSGKLNGPDIQPRKKGRLIFTLPTNNKDADALILNSYDKNLNKIYTWKWKIKSNKQIANNIIKSETKEVITKKSNSFIEIVTNNFNFYFSKVDGRLVKVKNGEKEIKFNNGPYFVSSINKGQNDFSKIKYKLYESGNEYVLDIQNHPELSKMNWSIDGSGWLKLKYEYISNDTVDYIGISFDYPEEKMHNMKWLGSGPYRVWKNRLKGTTIDVWQNDYKNYKFNTKWEYPEFVGYYKDISWVVFETEDGPITIVNESDDLFLRVFSQINGDGARHSEMIWPKGDISFLHKIPAIGTKFTKANELGPKSKKSICNGKYKGELNFYFGIPK